MTTITTKSTTNKTSKTSDKSSDKLVDTLESDQENMAETMYVIKRTGEREEVSFDKFYKRIQKLSKDLKINPAEVSKLIITQIYDGVETSKLDELAAEICAARSEEHTSEL